MPELYLYQHCAVKCMIQQMQRVGEAHHSHEWSTFAFDTILLIIDYFFWHFNLQMNVIFPPTKYVFPKEKTNKKNLKVLKCRFSILNFLWAVLTDCLCWFAWVDASHMIKSYTTVKCQLILHGQKSFDFPLFSGQTSFFPLPLSLGVIWKTLSRLPPTAIHGWHTSKEREVK